MLAENLIIALLTVLLLLTAVGLFLFYRKNSSAGAGDSVDVLQERLKSRQNEIDNLRARCGELEASLASEQAACVSLREKLTRQETMLQEARNNHEEKIRLLESAREKMSDEFKNLANEILEKKGQAFTEVNRQNIESILKPLSEKIQGFEKKVEETYDKESKERFSLTEHIKNLQDLNARISEDAVNLTNALKGESKTQGIWGEVILERVLEKSGLSKGREYEAQVSLKTAEGKSLQPDIIVHLPDNKDVIIDSKVSLRAYEQYCRAEDETERKDCLKQHILSIRQHIKGLSGKSYQNLEAVRSLDFVMLFLPVEAAFSLAVQEDGDIFTEAFEKNIVLVGPSTLLATLRTIQNIWRYEYQNKNALDIAKRAGQLYDKFVAFAADLEDVGFRINQTQASYDQAYKKLIAGRGNLVSHVEKLKVLGARASKSLPDKLLDSAGLDQSADDAAVALIEDSEEA